jgi:hypothetical protein
MGLEHGIGEVLQGNRPTGGMFIASWPGSAFLEIMAGEPAMTLIPNYLATGLLAICFSCLFLVLVLRPRPDVRLMLALLALMLITGAGFGPPLLGLIVVLIAVKRDSPLRGWRKLPAGLHGTLGDLWPWSFGLCMLGWLMMFPGSALVAYFTGSDDVLLMFVPIIIGFALIPVTLLLGFSRDVLRREEAAAGHAAS